MRILENNYDDQRTSPIAHEILGHMPTNKSRLSKHLSIVIGCVRPTWTEQKDSKGILWFDV